MGACPGKRKPEHTFAEIWLTSISRHWVKSKHLNPTNALGAESVQCAGSKMTMGQGVQACNARHECIQKNQCHLCVDENCQITRERWV
mmetsp:Transcript_26249/g.44692  ORF Transcript_26249/g.44692 Transcript_26249/m.44692 type:complete len:88 (-) Transcript_26249:147-410(-)